MMMYDYGDWGKLYQPFGDNRFMYVGEKPEGYLFGCKLFMKTWEAAIVDKKFPHAIIGSGKKKKKRTATTWTRKKRTNAGKPLPLQRPFRCAQCLSRRARRMLAKLGI